MKKKLLNRAAAIGVSALLAAGTAAMFTGCTTSNDPEVTITYSFNGEDYAVHYVLSRVDAPKTVQHFIELADAGFYDGLVVHDYQNYTMKAGGYRLVDGELVEVNYLEEVRRLEEEKDITFTQSVWADEARTIPLYSVYGEFSANGVEQENGKEYVHEEGALVMYYTDKGEGRETVWVERADGGADNDGNAYQELGYGYNSTTSLFYTFMGESRASADATYCVIGMATNYNEEMTNGLLAAINEYEDTLDEDDTFTTAQEAMPLNRYDYFRSVQTAGLTDDFETPVSMPIVIKSVTVDKY